MKYLILSISLIIIATGCSKDNSYDPDNPLIGVWNYAGFDNNDVFTRSDEFADTHCYKFLADGTMIERKNSGWCGTPPVTYADYQGEWELVNDTLLQINVGYWGGTTSYRLDIQHVDSKSLIVSYASAE